MLLSKLRSAKVNVSQSKSESDIVQYLTRKSLGKREPFLFQKRNFKNATSVTTRFKRECVEHSKGHGIGGTQQQHGGGRQGQHGGHQGQPCQWG